LKKYKKFTHAHTYNTHTRMPYRYAVTRSIYL